MSGRNRHPRCPSNGRPFQEARMAARQAAGSPDQADAAAAGAVDPPLHTHIDSKPNRGLRSWWWCRWRRRSTQEPLVEAGLGVGESEAARDWRSVCRLSMAGCLWRRSYCRETAPEDKPHVRRRTWLWRLPDSLIICLRRFDNECRKVVPQKGVQREPQSASLSAGSTQCQSLRRFDNECRKVPWYRRSATCLKTTILRETCNESRQRSQRSDPCPEAQGSLGSQRRRRGRWVPNEGAGVAGFPTKAQGSLGSARGSEGPQRPLGRGACQGHGALEAKGFCTTVLLETGTLPRADAVKPSLWIFLLDL